MDYSPPGSSVHGDSLGKNTRAGCHAILQISKVKKDTRRRCRGGRGSFFHWLHGLEGAPLAELKSCTQGAAPFDSPEFSLYQLPPPFFLVTASTALSPYLLIMHPFGSFFFSPSLLTPLFLPSVLTPTSNNRNYSQIPRHMKSFHWTSDLLFPFPGSPNSTLSPSACQLLLILHVPRQTQFPFLSLSCLDDLLLGSHSTTLTLL